MSDFPPADGLEGPRREPIFAIPPVVVALIVALIGAYAVFDFLAPATQDAALARLRFPARAADAGDVARRLPDRARDQRPNALAEATLRTSLVLDIAQPWTL